MTLKRGVVTDWLLYWISGKAFLVTDISAEAKALPDVFGWSGDMADAESYFNPYIIMMPQSGVMSSPPGLGAPVDWVLSYTMSIYGVDRRQVEDLADDLRNQIVGPNNIDLDMDNGTSWTLTYVEVTTIGGVAYNGQVDPAYYSQTDSYTIRVSQSL